MSVNLVIKFFTWTIISYMLGLWQIKLYINVLFFSYKTILNWKFKIQKFHL